MKNNKDYTSGFYFAFCVCYIFLSVMASLGWNILRDYGWLMLSISSILFALCDILSSCLDYISDSRQFNYDFGHTHFRNDQIYDGIARVKRVEKTDVIKLFDKAEKVANNWICYYAMIFLKWTFFISGVLSALLSGYFAFNSQHTPSFLDQMNNSFSLLTIAMMFLSYFGQSYFRDKGNRLNSVRGTLDRFMAQKFKGEISL